MRPYLAAALAIVILGGPAWGQSHTDISQKTGGQCSPAVISNGKVTITCIGLDRRQQEMLSKIPGLIDQLLKRNQSDRAEILAKLEEILKHEERATQAAVTVRNDLATLEQKTSLIKGMNAVVSIKLEAAWKDGLVPDPSKMIFAGGNPKGLEATFELSNGDHEVVQFYGTQGQRIYPLDGKVTAFEYQSVATPDSKVFGMNPKNIVAITQIGFATYGLHSAALASPEIKIRQLSIQFFVNGAPSFDCDLDINEQLDMSRKDKSLEEIWMWNGHANLQHAPGVAAQQGPRPN